MLVWQGQDPLQALAEVRAGAAREGSRALGRALGALLPAGHARGVGGAPCWSREDLENITTTPAQHSLECLIHLVADKSPAEVVRMLLKIAPPGGKYWP